MAIQIAAERESIRWEERGRRERERENLETMATVRRGVTSIGGGGGIAGTPEAVMTEKTIGDDSPAAFESADEAEVSGATAPAAASAVPAAATADTAGVAAPAVASATVDAGVKETAPKKEEQQQPLSIRERELVLRAKQLKLAQREKEIAEEKTRLMERQLELEERLASRQRQQQQQQQQRVDIAGEKQPLVEVDKNSAALRATPAAVPVAAAVAVADAAQKIQKDAQNTQVDLMTRVHSLEEKVAQAQLVRLGLVPPVPPTLYPPASAVGTSSSYDENLYSASYFPTQKAQAALYSAKATSEMPKLESLRHYFESKESQIAMRLDHVAFNLDNLQKLEDEIAKKKQEIRNNIYVTCGNVQELIEQRQNELLRQVDDVYAKHSKKIAEHRQQVLDAQRNLCEARQLASVVVANNDIANANIDWDQYKEQFESSMNKTEQRIVWFNAMKLSSLQETNSLFGLDCDTITNTINRRMVFNYYKDGTKDLYELHRRVWDMLVEVGEDVAHAPLPPVATPSSSTSPAPATAAPPPVFSDFQFHYLMTKVAELITTQVITKSSTTTAIRELVTLLFAESREQEPPQAAGATHAPIVESTPAPAPAPAPAPVPTAPADTSSTTDETVQSMQQRLANLESLVTSTFQKLNVSAASATSTVTPPPMADDIETDSARMEA